MFENHLIFLSVLCWTVGFLFGLVAAKKFKMPKGHEATEKQLANSNQLLREYHLNVIEYHSAIASNIEQLSKNFNDLEAYTSTHSHLIDNTAQNIDSIHHDTKTISATSKTFGLINPPLDYAEVRGNVGTLSENYGLNDERTLKPRTGEV